MFPLKNYKGIIPELPHLGAFGAKRKFHTHEGVDLYVPNKTPVYAVEPGKIVAVENFTGPLANSPWWHDTKCVMVKGKSGVVNYGEIDTQLKPGTIIEEGDLIGLVKQVLKKDKGRPMSMLHFELYEDNVTESVEWLPDADRPKGLLDPTELLKSL